MSCKFYPHPELCGHKVCEDDYEEEYGPLSQEELDEIEAMNKPRHFGFADHSGTVDQAAFDALQKALADLPKGPCCLCKATITWATPVDEDAMCEQCFLAIDVAEGLRPADSEAEAIRARLYQHERMEDPMGTGKIPDKWP